MYRFAASALAGALCCLLLLSSASNGQKDKDKKDKDKAKPGTIVKFTDYHDHVKKATFTEYKKKTGFKASNAAAFKKMKDYLLERQKNKKVKHTFVSKNGHPVDCVPLNQQPALKHPLLQDHKIQTKAPKLPKALTAGMKKAPGTAKGVSLANAKDVPAGTIPIRRLTLSMLTRFKTLADFRRKFHGGGGGHQLHKPEVGATPHRYAVGRQTVNNYGGSSWLNIWRPVPTATNFSLSQVWYYGGSPIQTIEAGWQVYPQFYGHNDPVLFIYWTADGYNKTGAYNLDAPGFVQVNHTFYIGGRWSPVSTTGGTQYGFQCVWYKDPSNGNWWLWLRGAGSLTAIGYYPRALFGSGQTSKNAVRCTFGGEVTGTSSGQMGSGQKANQGWAKAAFQKEIYYFPTQKTSAWAKLSSITPDPKCYTTDIHDNSGTAWGTYLYFGGPKCP